MKHIGEYPFPADCTFFGETVRVRPGQVEDAAEAFLRSVLHEDDFDRVWLIVMRERRSLADVVQLVAKLISEFEPTDAEAVPA